ncbi:helix-turn-helix transcriptional regulator [Ventrimonas sp. CLA-AP-H27]|uniref:Helix-turn-helix transcriptional regulator n=1 Tax=Ventrimonas faecis TaxID=3133170 RepID=A0ABV1HPM8_9FIRM
MIKNNFELDIKMKCLESGLTQAQLGERIGTSEQYVNRVIKQKAGNILNKTFVKMMEAMGYDVVVSYEKRNEE